MLLFGVNTVYNRAGCVKYMYRRCRNMYFTPTYSRYALNGYPALRGQPATAGNVQKRKNERR